MSSGRLCVLSTAVLAACVSVGCGSEAASPGMSEPDAARASARAFYSLFFNGHQRGELSNADWRRLADVTSAPVERELRAQYRGLRGLGGPRCRMAQLTVRN